LPRALSGFSPKPPPALPLTRPLRACLGGLILGALMTPLAPAIAAAEDAIPEPLSLDQALTYAAGHPRVRLGTAAADLPRSPPLYLDCERLAFSHLDSEDSRSRPSVVLLAPLPAQHLEIMARFLDVLLADLSYARYNEAMAVAYIQYDRANIRRELGQYAELRVAELETAYQDVLRKRAASETSQRLTRDLLAQAMGRPGELPSDLTPPQLTLPPDELPNLDAVMAQAAEQAWPHPPAIASDPALAKDYRRLLDMELRRQALELLSRLNILKTSARYAESEAFMRDLKLDESRTLYEQEVKADLGYSMSQQTMARLHEDQVRYCRALGWAELNALQGRSLLSEPEVETTP